MSVSDSKQKIVESGIVENPNFDNLRIECEEFMRFMREEYCVDEAENYESAIFEAAMTAFFGEGVWEWIMMFEE